MKIAPRWVWSIWGDAAREALDALEASLAPPRSPWFPLCLVLLSTIAAWFVYVPIHELLHAFGCMATGGRVGELQMAPLYGGRMFESLLPFVRAGGDYAGRLTDFDTGGSDATYLATDLTPYLLTVVGAFPLVRSARRRRSALLLGPGLVLLAAPVLSLPGDYYEIGSILVSAALTALAGGAAEPGWLALRHDDLFKPLGELGTRFPDRALAGGLALTASLLVGAALAGATLAASRMVADFIAPLTSRSKPI